MCSASFGWDLLFKSVEKDIKRNEELLVCLAHLVLISNDFKCVGVGESKNIDGSETKSETLPKGWNIDYAIRYVYQGRLYNFKAAIIEDSLILNLVRVDERRAGTMELKVEQVVSRSGSLDEMIPDNKKIINDIKEKIIDKLVVSTRTKDNSSQTQSECSSSRRTIRSAGPASLQQNYVDDYMNFPHLPYGQADLNPFPIYPVGPRIIGSPGGGGGMIFTPPRINPGGLGGVYPGSIPPGARYDPIRPRGIYPEPPRRPPNRPDNDEFPPPGYDDMFM